MAGQTTISRQKRGRPEAKGNKSILTFFKKVEVEESLFLDEPSPSNSPGGWNPNILNDSDDLYTNNAPIDQKFDEIEQQHKRQKLDEPVETPSRHSTITARKSTKYADIGGFVIYDSDDSSNDDVDHTKSNIPALADQEMNEELSIYRDISENIKPERKIYSTKRPSLEREELIRHDTNGTDDFLNFDIPGIDKWPEDPDFEEPGNREYKYSQQRVELELNNEEIYCSKNAPDNVASEDEKCPVCEGSFVGTTADEATKHVNACLDGNPTPLSNTGRGQFLETKVDKIDVDSDNKTTSTKPNPITVTSTSEKSAFLKLMANQTEEAAWSIAAAENQVARENRAKRGQVRKCPFYKVIPGFSIAVDAFRYGAVKGVHAYFLSHFHSDHYVGLSSNWRHGPIYCSRATASLSRQQLKVDEKWLVPLEFETWYDVPRTGGVRVFMIDANHCPGSSLFLFEKFAPEGKPIRPHRILHCGDFRACQAHVMHPLLQPEITDPETGRVQRQTIDACYLDTTYLNPRYSFPPQEDVIRACADLCAFMQANPGVRRPWDHSESIRQNYNLLSRFFSITRKSEKPVAQMNSFNVASESANRLLSRGEESHPPNRLLVVCGTYSIGKERIVLAIAKALDTKIFAPANKRRITKALGDPELDARLTTNPLEAQVHMQSLMDIKVDNLKGYLERYKPHFGRVLAFRPSGWNFSPNSGIISRGNGNEIGASNGNFAMDGSDGGPAPSTLKKSTSPSSVPTTALLHHRNWRTRFSVESLRPGRGWTDDSMIFGVPYSEHSSFRDLALFVMGLDIGKVVPTVNVGSKESRNLMRAWVDRWTAERRRGGFVVPLALEPKVSEYGEGREKKRALGRTGP